VRIKRWLQRPTTWVYFGMIGWGVGGLLDSRFVMASFLVLAMAATVVKVIRDIQHLERRVTKTNNRVTVAELGIRVTHLEKGMDDIKETVEGMSGKLTAILVSLTTAAVLFALNLAAGAIGIRP